MIMAYVTLAVKAEINTESNILKISVQRGNKMDTLMQEINNLLEAKNSRISFLEWEVSQLKKENEELKNNVAKHNENEVNRV